MIIKTGEFFKYEVDPRTDIFLNKKYESSASRVLREGERCLDDFNKDEKTVSLNRHRKVIETNFLGKRVFAKSYSPSHTEHLGNKLKNISLFATTAMREFKALKKIMNLGLPTVVPLAVIERIIKPFYKESIIITEAEEGIDAASIISSGNRSMEEKRNIFERSWEYLEEMKRAGIFDSDYKFRNLLYRKKNGGFSLVIFDKERVRRMWSALAGLKMRGKFIANWINLLIVSGDLFPGGATNEIGELKARLNLENDLNSFYRLYLDHCIHKKLKFDIS